MGDGEKESWETEDYRVKYNWDIGVKSPGEYLEFISVTIRERMASCRERVKDDKVSCYNNILKIDY
jgi:hypothetical protein